MGVYQLSWSTLGRGFFDSSDNKNLLGQKWEIFCGYPSPYYAVT